ncbi:MAG: acyl-CoA dehydratase activase [Bacillota bacterium]
MLKDKYYLGIDVGSVSVDFALLNENYKLMEKIYLKTEGKPIKVIKDGIDLLKQKIDNEIKIKAVGTTGSGRKLAGVMVGADVIKNEITAHAVAAVKIIPEVKTVLEIGGQDSKIIIIRDGIAVDFAMNTVCAAGTGSFLEQQARRLGIEIEKFGDLAIEAKEGVRIAGRCSVFAESDMIHKQQLGYNTPEIIAGLSEALVRNYLNNVAKGKEIKAPIVFQGGVAANKGIKAAFAKELDKKIYVPKEYDVMGAIGAAILGAEKINFSNKRTLFKGFKLSDFNYKADSFICDGCANGCEIVNIYQNGQLIARWGARCERWQLKESS